MITPALPAGPAQRASRGGAVARSILIFAVPSICMCIGAAPGVASLLPPAAGLAAAPGFAPVACERALPVFGAGFAPGAGAAPRVIPGGRPSAIVIAMVMAKSPP